MHGLLFLFPGHSIKLRNMSFLITRPEKLLQRSQANEKSWRFLISLAER